MSTGVRQVTLRAIAVLLAAFVLFEVNYPTLRPQSELAIFATLGLVACFLSLPLRARWAGRLWSALLDWLLAGLAVLTGAYVVVQTEPGFRSLWLAGQGLGDRAGAELPVDYAVGVVGVLIVLEATRRCVGLALPILSGAFLLYAYYGQLLPDWLFPHRGYPLERIVSQTYLHSQGVFGVALSVMFTYVFVFVLFGALLEGTGAIAFVLGLAQRVFRGSPGAPAKVSVFASGLMGSLSGSAVANTATTGTFTIPLMRNAGFAPHVAAGVEAAASSGGALVPPVMGAGAYMMLEIIDPPVTYLQIVKAALWPALLYYFSLFLVVHFSAKRLLVLRQGPAAGGESAATRGGEAGPGSSSAALARPPSRWSGVLFVVALAVLLVLLVVGYTVFRAVSLAMLLVWVLSVLRPETRLDLRGVLRTLERAARGAMPLICAAASVGIVLGVVTLTGLGTRLPAALLPLAEESLTLALLLLMVSSLILGMGLPSAVCYLLLATLVGPVLGDLGVVPLAAHLFIFYFGMMAMVTPPVALAGYTAASIAGSDIMRSSFAAFRFALAGFTLPFMFVFRPQLLLLGPGGEGPSLLSFGASLSVAVLGLVPLAAGIAGFLLRPLGVGGRTAALLAAGLLLFPGKTGPLGELGVSLSNFAGAALLLVLGISQWRAARAGAERELA